MICRLKNISLSAIVIFAFAACERMPENNTANEYEQERYQDSVRAVHVRDSIATAEANAQAARKPKSADEALKQDAQLARTMSLEQFSRHMQTRKAYYSQFEKVKYEDEYVKIKMEDDELKIETPTGKAKFDEEGSKIKTDTYKKKTERK